MTADSRCRLEGEALCPLLRCQRLPDQSGQIAADRRQPEEEANSLRTGGYAALGRNDARTAMTAFQAALAVDQPVELGLVVVVDEESPAQHVERHHGGRNAEERRLLVGGEAQMRSQFGIHGRNLLQTIRKSETVAGTPVPRI